MHRNTLETILDWTTTEEDTTYVYSKMKEVEDEISRFLGIEQDESRQNED